MVKKECKYITTAEARKFLSLDDKPPSKVRELERKCFCCGKVHLVCGGIILKRLAKYIDDKKKTHYIFTRHAPLGCWLAHNKKYIQDFYKNKEWYGWKELRGSVRK